MISVPLWSLVALFGLCGFLLMLLIAANINANKQLTKLQRENSRLKVDLDLCREFASAKVKRRVLREVK